MSEYSVTNCSNFQHNLSRYIGKSPYHSDLHFAPTARLQNWKKKGIVVLSFGLFFYYYFRTIYSAVLIQSTGSPQRFIDTSCKDCNGQVSDIIRIFLFKLQPHALHILLPNLFSISSLAAGIPIIF